MDDDGYGGGDAMQRRDLDEEGLPSVKFSANQREGGDGGISDETRLQRIARNQALDNRYGFDLYVDIAERVGWLLNMQPTEYANEERRLVSAVDLYFIDENSDRFKIRYTYKPYFYLETRQGKQFEVAAYASRRFQGQLAAADVVEKEDLAMPNHLCEPKRSFVKLSFFSVTELMNAKKLLQPIVNKNRDKSKNKQNTAFLYDNDGAGGGRNACNDDDDDTLNSNHTKQHYNHDKQHATRTTAGSAALVETFILDFREYDIPYHVRVSIDRKIFVGKWYSVTPQGNNQPPRVDACIERDELPDSLCILAYDIECTKADLKFPDAQHDEVMMISYMIDGQGFLLINRQIVMQDIHDFEYTPRSDFNGKFRVENLADERALLLRFIHYIQQYRPNIIVTYNGDFFDWPFVAERCRRNQINLYNETGFYFSTQQDAFISRNCVHMDAIHWVRRDSYLPAGSHGLKAVAKAKLQYDPVELDPEEMMRKAREEPEKLASYSVSDAVATYYLYKEYVHPFIFALCTIIPMEPDSVLRKGSGTLCESLLMVQAFDAHVIFPNKQLTSENKLTDSGHVLDSETYVGASVEALESGIFRADIPCRFRIVPAGCDELLSKVEKTVALALHDSCGELLPEDAENFDEICADIRSRLENLKATPLRTECPLIYHLDVQAMYPNIILTNRLQPSAVVEEKFCAQCNYNKPENKCKRSLPWTWRGEYMPATRSEYQRIRHQLEMERFPPVREGEPPRAFHQLSREERMAVEKKRLTSYCKTVYRKQKVTETRDMETITCQRENPFYIDTVRSFRDRRYEYKKLHKQWKQRSEDARKNVDFELIARCKAKEVIYDSLQLALKCILNSFYGYVMRKGARWFSMEMAGIVCYAGASIITRARQIVEQIGRPLELDTDGIWCALPNGFPETYTVRRKADGSKAGKFSYPGAMLNLMVREEFTNPQYQTWDQPLSRFRFSTENSIEFEVDGPYLAMILPAAKEEGKKLKKRYAVFSMDGSLAELKGFEIKRRGELRLIKEFQSEIFDAFKEGATLEEAYAATGRVCNKFLDILFTQGAAMPEDELMDLISEGRSMSREISSYGQQKSLALTTARRLAQFLGDDVVRDAGLNCKFIIAKKPEGTTVTERAIPTKIFQREPTVRRRYLRQWMKHDPGSAVELADVVDWQYYIERLSSAIQKIVTIPACMQNVPNPVPRAGQPEWLHKQMLQRTDHTRQLKLTDLFTRQDMEEQYGNTVAQKRNAPTLIDMEDDVTDSGSSKKPAGMWRKFLKPRQAVAQQTTEAEIDEPPPFIISGGTPAQLKTFLVHQRRKWQLQRHRYRLDKHHNRNPTNQPQTSIGSWMLAERRTLAKSPWHIIQICQSYQIEVKNSSLGTQQPIQRTLRAQPGIFDMWIICGEQLRRVKLSVCRKFYVNSMTRLTDAELATYGAMAKIRLVAGNSMKLPRSRPTYFLYEFQLDESQYVGMAEHFRSQLLAPRVEGIYELNVPLMFRALLQCGCVCRVRADAIDAVMKRDFGRIELDELEALPCAQSSMEALQSSSSMSTTGGGVPSAKFGDLKVANYVPVRRYVFLYEQASENGRRALYALVFPAPLNKVHVFVLDTLITNNVGDVRRKIASLVEERKAWNAQQRSAARHKPCPAGDFTVTVKAHNKRQILLDQMEAVLKDYRTSVLVIQAAGGRSTPLESWYEKLPSCNEMPCILLQHSSSSSVDAFGDILQWQRKCSDEMCRAFVDLDLKLAEQIQNAKFFGIPLGNMPLDHTLLACDLTYARYLLHNNVILWATHMSRPDLGGKKMDDVRLITDDEDRVLEINRRGCYDTVTFRLDVEYAAVNAVLQQQHIYEGEGTQAAVAFDNAPQQRFEEMLTTGSAHHNMIMATMVSDFDEKAQCATAARVLRQMLFDMVRLTTDRRSVSADQILVNFYRWLRTPAALMYDPALHRMLTQLQRKMLMQLLNEYRALGCDVVYANTNTLVVATRNKYTRDDAMIYIEYAAQAIKAKPQFSYLEIRAELFWYFLLWWDPANYRGFIDGSLADEGEIVGSGDADEIRALTNGEDEFQDEKEEHDEDVGHGTDNRGENGAPLPDEDDDVVDGKLKSQQSQSQSRRRSAKLTSDFDDADETASNNPDPEQQQLDGNQYEKIIDKILQNLLLDGDFSMARHLPDNVRDRFDKLVSTYILHSYGITSQLFVYADDAGDRGRRFAQSVTVTEQENGEGEKTNGENFSSSNAQEQANDRHYTSLVRKTFGDYVSRDALQAVYDINRSLPTATVAASSKTNNSAQQKNRAVSTAFRFTPGMRLYDDRPALEFIKLLCEILAADKRIARDVRDMRANLLALMQIREFAAAAQFHDPNPTYVLPDVQCGACSHVRNLDICRDVNVVLLPPVDLLPIFAAANAGAVPVTAAPSVKMLPRWCCDHCSAPYDMDEIEERLLDVIRRINVVYQVQDVACAKCHAVRNRYMGSTCDQCGCQELETMTKAQTVHERVQILASVARHFGLRVLGDSLAMVMKLNGLKADGFVIDGELGDL